MSGLLLALLVAVVLTNFRLLGGSRLVPLIRSAAFQGVLLAGFAVAVRLRDLQQTAALAALGTALVKGIVLPNLLLHALRRVEIRREVEPLVGYGASLALGGAALALAVAAGSGLADGSLPGADLAPATALFTLFTGLFLVISRRKALTQVLGYLVFENGIYALGVTLQLEQPLLVELGVLLDLLVAVFVMGIVVFHIGRSFEHIDVDQLVSLREETAPPPSRDVAG